MRMTKLARVLLITKRKANLDTKLISREHPTVAIGLTDTLDACEVIIDSEAWSRADGFTEFDHAIESSRSDVIAVHGAEVERTACEVLTRYQRHICRHNTASAEARFDTVLRTYAALHDLTKPLVAADHAHALDTWQWTLRLDAYVSFPTQLAALLHDIERLESEADRRVEHHAPDYQAFKDAHAKRGAERAAEFLADAGIDHATCSRVRAIVASHERRGGDPEVDLLNDADGLSFFSLNSAGYADYFGPEQTRRKIVYTLGRMGAPARARLSLVRLRRDIGAWVREAMG